MYRLNRERVEELRQERGISLVELANSACVDYFALKRCLDGEETKFNLVSKLAIYFNVPTDYIILTDGDESTHN